MINQQIWIVKKMLLSVVMMMKNVCENNFNHIKCCAGNKKLWLNGFLKVKEKG